MRARSCGSIARAGKSHRHAAARLPAPAPLTRRDTRRGLESAIRRTTSGSRHLRRATLTRLTLDPGLDRFPVWTPDSQRIMFGSTRRRAASISGGKRPTAPDAERLTSGNLQFPHGDHTRRDRRRVSPKTSDEWRPHAVRARGDPTGEPLLQTTFDNVNGSVSPDGRWIAYDSNSSGSIEDLRPAISQRRGRPMASLDGGRDAAALGARRAELFYLSTPPTAR